MFQFPALAPATRLRARRAPAHSGRCLRHAVIPPYGIGCASRSRGHWPPLRVVGHVNVSRVARHKPCRVSPFGNPRIKACSAAPRGLSQPATSFIAFWRQGIPHAPLVAWPFHQISIRFFGRTGSLPMNGLRESAQHSNVLDFGSHLSENASTRLDAHGVSRTRAGQAPAVGADRRPIPCVSKITPPA